jgi:hypothetical protein
MIMIDIYIAKIIDYYAYTHIVIATDYNQLVEVYAQVEDDRVSFIDREFGHLERWAKRNKFQIKIITIRVNPEDLTNDISDVFALDLKNLTINI